MNDPRLVSREGVYVPPAIPGNGYREFWQQKLGRDDFSDQQAYRWSLQLEAAVLTAIPEKKAEDLPPDPNIWVVMLKIAGCRLPFRRQDPAQVIGP
jgi:hypothetical protein